MKKLLILILIILFFNFIKNIYLNNKYLKYHIPINEEVVLNNVGDEYNNGIAGKWIATIITIRHGMEFKHKIEYIFNKDSTGNFTNIFFSERILGIQQVEVFSWSSLLPFSDDNYQSYSTPVLISDNKIIHINGLSESIDTTVETQYNLESHGKLIINNFTTLNDSPGITFGSTYREPSFFEFIYLGLIPI